MSTVSKVYQDLQTAQDYIQEGAKWCLAMAIGAFLSKFHFTKTSTQTSLKLKDHEMVIFKSVIEEPVKLLLNTMPITLFTLSIIAFLTSQALQAALKSDSLGLVEQVG